MLFTCQIFIMIIPTRVDNHFIHWWWPLY